MSTASSARARCASTRAGPRPTPGWRWATRCGCRRCGWPSRRPRGAPAPAREFPVLFEDEHLLAIDKPAGVAVHGGTGVSFGVIEQLRRARPEAKFLELVHRLDKDTSGVLLLAKKRSALTALQDQFRQPGDRSTRLTLRWSSARWPANKKVIDVALHKTLDAEGERHVRPVRGRPCRWPALDHAGQGGAQASARFTLLEVTFKTGRTHQIRVHLANEGQPIVGDPKYGDFALNREMARGEHRFTRMFLHARQLAFDHPASGERIELSAPLPPELRVLAARHL